MSNNYFTFKQFTVYHDKCAMKVGTDGVLLGAWAGTETVTRVLDVGTGTGLIAIMLAQRSTALIDAVEIDESACLQASDNVAACPWKGRIRIYNVSFQHFTDISTFRYELIVSNPPYFRNSLKPPLKSRSLARHAANLDFDRLLSCTSQLLAPEGRLALIIPAGDARHLIELACFHGLYPMRKLWVRPSPGKELTRCLMEFSDNKNQTCSESELIIKRSDLVTYSDDYMALNRSYYLNF